MQETYTKEMIDYILREIQEHNKTVFETIPCPLCGKKATLLRNDFQNCTAISYCHSEGKVLKSIITMLYETH